MHLRRVFVTAALVLGGAAVLAPLAATGCGDEERPERVLSRKGEACNVTGDCASGLACVPVPGGSIGVCTLGSFGVAPTARECALIECREALDCCATPPSNCPSLQAQCLADAGSTSTFACQQYDALCKCDTSKTACEQSKCITRCTIDSECNASPSGRKCAGGKCVQCAIDPDCGPGQTCLSGACQSPCETDGDCPGFGRCLAGRCLESGCQTDRECIAATRNVEATCGTDGKCKVPCATDLECGNPKDYSFFSCIDAECVYTGCQSDKDCRLFYTGASDASTLPTKQHVVCRDRTTPGPTTKPAN